MKILLDTHAFLWWDSSPEKLPPGVLELLTNAENSIFLSVASVWEVQIKTQLGKLSLSIPLDEMLESQRQVNSVEILPVHLRHVLALGHLPAHHKDPFDRMLIAQAKTEDMLISSADPAFAHYDVKVVWD
jgi:PIN domain nuclease of toxin-antitoxin system